MAPKDSRVLGRTMFTTHSDYEINPHPYFLPLPVKEQLNILRPAIIHKAAISQ